MPKSTGEGAAAALSASAAVNGKEDDGLRNGQAEDQKGDSTDTQPAPSSSSSSAGLRHRRKAEGDGGASDRALSSPAQGSEEGKTTRVSNDTQVASPSPDPSEAVAAVADAAAGAPPAATSSQAVGRGGLGLLAVTSCLLLLASFYGVLGLCARHLIFDRADHVKTAEEAGPAGFSEERAMAHVVKLAEEIGPRQEGTQGLMDAADYILQEVMRVQSKASNRIRVEVEVSYVSGSFSMNFLKHNLALAYHNLTNVLVRVSAASASPDAASVLVNGHFDSAISSQGAADCASCVATMLETMRQVVEGDIVPPSPFIFLFNGGEEIFLKAAHGFVLQHNWSQTVGAFVNLEAAGTRLPDIVVQTNGAPWVQRVYAKTTPYPMGSVISQDVFPHIPGDTDFRILAQDFDDVPGFDIMYTLNGYAYHTKLDTPQALQRGALQVRGDNLLPLLLGLASAPELLTRAERRMAQWSDYRPARGGKGERSASAAERPGARVPVFFDLFRSFMVVYSQDTSTAMVTVLLSFLLLLLPRWSSESDNGTNSIVVRYQLLALGLVCYLMGWVSAIILPATAAGVRVVGAQSSMNWYADPIAIHVGSVSMAVVGLITSHLLLAYLVKKIVPHNTEVATEWAAHWGGVVGFNAVFCAAVTAVGGGSGYLGLWWALLLLPSRYLTLRLQTIFGENSLLSPLGYLVPGAVPAAYCTVFYGFFTQFIIEKMGASGTHPMPEGPIVQDSIVAGSIGAMTALCAAPFVGMLRRWLGHGPLIRILINVALLANARLCVQFPYSHAAPKRVIVQSTFWTDGSLNMTRAAMVVASADANDAIFVLKWAPRFHASLLRWRPPQLQEQEHLQEQERLLLLQQQQQEQKEQERQLQQQQGEGEGAGNDNTGTGGGDEGGSQGMPRFEAPWLKVNWTLQSNLSDIPTSAQNIWLTRQLPLGYDYAPRPSLLAWYPVSELLDRPIMVEGVPWQGEERGVEFPHLSLVREEEVPGLPEDEGKKRRRIHLELKMGSLSRVWGAVLNITGPLVSWSLTDQKLPEPHIAKDGSAPPSYMLHLGGGNGNVGAWPFWLEARGNRRLRVRLAVMDLDIHPEAAHVVDTFPRWIAPYATSSYLSKYRF